MRSQFQHLEAIRPRIAKQQQHRHWYSHQTTPPSLLYHGNNPIKATIKTQQ